MGVVKMQEAKQLVIDAVNEWYKNRRVSVIGKVPDFITNQAKKDNENYKLMLKFIEGNCKDV